MILIPPLRTRRLNVQFKEVTIGEAIRLAGIHPKQHEYATTAFLQSIIESATAPTDKHEADPRLWTVQERTLAVCHYLAATADNGEADFKVGDHGRLTDYMDTGRDYVPMAEAGEAAQDRWRMIPLTGMAAEVLERLEGGVDGVPEGRMHWLIGTMAAQLVRVDEHGRTKDDPAPTSDAELTDWLRERMKVFSSFPESDFMQLLVARSVGSEGVAHLFNMEPADDGLVCVAKEKGEGDQLPPARFPVGECISELAKELARSLPQSAQQPGPAHRGNAATGR